MTRQLHLGGFQIASQATHSHAAWRHPRQRHPVHHAGLLPPHRTHPGARQIRLSVLCSSPTCWPPQPAAARKPPRRWTRTLKLWSSWDADALVLDKAGDHLGLDPVKVTPPQRLQSVS